MHPRVVVPQMLDLEVLYRLYDLRRHQQLLLRNARQIFESVQKTGRGGSEKRSSLSGYDRPVVQLESDCRASGLFRPVQSGLYDGPVVRARAERIHEELYLSGLAAVAEAAPLGDQRVVVSANYLLLGSLSAGLVVDDAEAAHVDAHIRGALVGALPADLLEDGVENGEDLDIAVIIDGRLAVGLQVEGVYHVDVVQVRRGGFIGQVNGVL